MFARFRRLILFLAVSDALLTQLVLWAAEWLRREGPLGLALGVDEPLLTPILRITAGVITTESVSG